jgi:hypothetical protein
MAKKVSLVHPQQRFDVLGELLVQKCDLFRDDPTLTVSPYTLTSQVSVSDFRTFVTALEGASVSITKDNLGGLTQLCKEFHFGDLEERLSQFRESDDLKEDVTLNDFEARKRLSALEERMQQHDREIAALRADLSRHLRLQESSSEGLLGRVARLEAEVSALRTESALARSTVPTQKSPPPSIVPSASITPAVPTSSLATPPSGSIPQAVVPIASASLRTSPASAVALRPSGWNSAIVPDFPKLFEDFKEKQFILLWRGSRDGCRPSEFHRRCDGHPNTLTLILDADGNIFGGFTPLEWDSGCYWKLDPSLKSFVFTLKNPHNFPARRFSLKAEKKDRAIWCASNCGPIFNDICVFSIGNAKRNRDSSASSFGENYTNDTGLAGKTFFTGSPNYQVKEIEVFEIRN